ncbi:MAG: ABC transporter permease, partial [Fibrobacteres bacterium]|nr:ABC transporter permease [Fibrobacterota bacterium]
MKTADGRWLALWLSVLAILSLWLLLFLNGPSRVLVYKGFLNSALICTLVIFFSMVLGWATAIIMHYLQKSKTPLYLLFTFLLNIIRSIPQIIGVLFGYVIITSLVLKGIVLSPVIVSILMAFSMSIFIFNEISDLILERIAYYRKLDFFDAMRVCGISEWHIVNSDIILKNSRIHLINKMISVFGAALFLQCSVDFIISVGLSTQVSSLNLPSTLGSLLAKVDSKQDI